MASSNSNFDEIIARAAAKHKLDPERIRRIIAAESGGDPNAVSKSGAQGLMQLMPNTAKEMGINNPFDPEQNIMGGSAYLEKLGGMFPGDEDKQHAAYNFGPGNVSAGKPYPPETQAYVEKMRSPSPSNSITPEEGGQVYTDEQGRDLYIEGKPTPEEIDDIFSQHYGAGSADFNKPTESETNPLTVQAPEDSRIDLSRAWKGTIPGQIAGAAREVSPPQNMGEALGRTGKSMFVDPVMGLIKGAAGYPAAAAERSQPYFEKGFKEGEPLRFAQGALATLPFAGEIVDPANKMLTGTGAESSQGASDVLSQIVNLGLMTGGANEALPELSKNIGKTLRHPATQGLASGAADYAARGNAYEAGAAAFAPRIMKKVLGVDPVSMIMDTVAKPFDWLGKFKGLVGEGGMVPGGKTGTPLSPAAGAVKSPKLGKYAPTPAIPNNVSATASTTAPVNPPSQPFQIPPGYRVKSLKSTPSTQVNAPPPEPVKASTAPVEESNYAVSKPPEASGPKVNTPQEEGYIQELAPDEVNKGVREKNLFNRLVEGKKSEKPPPLPLPEGVTGQKLNAAGDLEPIPQGRPKGSTTRDKGTNARAVEANPRSQLEKLRNDYDKATMESKSAEMRVILNKAKEYKLATPKAFKKYFGELD